MILIDQGLIGLVLMYYHLLDHLFQIENTLH